MTAETLAFVMRNHLIEPLLGLVGVKVRNDDSFIYSSNRSDIGVFDERAAAQNGWNVEQVRMVEPRDVAGLMLMEIVDVVNPKRFDP